MNSKVSVLLNVIDRLDSLFSLCLFVFFRLGSGRLPPATTHRARECSDATAQQVPRGGCIGPSKSWGRGDEQPHAINLEHCRQQRLANGLYCWRDNIGTGVDLLVERAGELRPMEMKSSVSVQPEWLRDQVSRRRHAAPCGGGAMWRLRVRERPC
ncbi:MAG: hypothetical protein H7242_05750 [Microbacteriaceae bacterium]|nr:hypothetical protein [Burkholderiaceae bacterium]